MENICRTCMLNKAEQPEMEQDLNDIKMIPIFIVLEEAKKEKLSVKELITTSVPQIKIEENDQLPKSICQKCLEKIQDIYNFQQKCVNIEEKFYKMLCEGDSIDSLNCPEYPDEELIKTEMVKNYLSQDDSMDYIADNDRIMEDEISGVDICNNFVESDCDESNGSDWEEMHQQSTSKNDTKSNSTKIKKREKKTKESPKEKLKQTSKKRKVRSKESNTKDIYPCGKCQRKLISKLSFIKHQEMHLKKDKEEQELKCSICKEEFTERIEFKNHQQSHIALNFYFVVDKPFLCSQCGKGFASAGSLKQHSFRHLDKKLYPCSDCPKSFPTKNDLLCHYEIHKAKPRIHVCDVCGRGFHKPFLLKQHQRYHNDERPFACEFCEKRFVTSEKQQRHMRTHTGEKPYRCKYCDRAFAQSNDCIKHLRQHLGENVYQCELCPLRFPLARDLRVHFASHKDDDDETRARNIDARIEEERNLQIKLSAQDI
ncbi:zinc finger protein 34-like isoform X1 [Calliphora vicina]|uniref:zinc finger protein 34-like isoform X1 n=1 Tax=Calliphora vicina TaxID=7373 RepID=UPI00325B1449